MSNVVMPLAELTELRRDLTEAETEVYRLIREIDRLRVDAERYRWIRAHSYVERMDISEDIEIHCGIGYQQDRPEFLDADIDSAMSFPRNGVEQP